MKHARREAGAFCSTVINKTMSGIFPNPPLFPSAGRDARPVCEWVIPARIPERDYARTRKALPPGMPDCVEVQIIRSEEGTERSVAAIYGARAYLVHYEFKPHRGR